MNPAPTESATLPASVIVAGPTAAGKTEVALQIARNYRVRLISVDSVQVYRGMDIGSAKPDESTLARFPHALIDIRDPDQAYTAADFVADATREMQRAELSGRIPVIVGGTAMYLKALRYGLDAMPRADADYRRRLEQRAERDGWAALHAELAEIDAVAAGSIRASDPQRIQRALEIHRATGRRPSEMRTGPGGDRLRRSLMIIVCPGDRAALHRRIEQRWERMLELGLISEVQRVAEATGWDRDLPSMRAVGYRQTLDHLSGRFPVEELPARGAAATRQLAKRQLTAFRQWSGGLWYDPLNRFTSDRIIKRVGGWSGIAPNAARSTSSPCRRTAPR